MDLSVLQIWPVNATWDGNPCTLPVPIIVAQAHFEDLFSRSLYFVPYIVHQAKVQIVLYECIAKEHITQCLHY